MTEFCYGVVNPDGMLEKRTLFDAPRGAKVNLMFLAGVPVRDSWSDDMIAQVFQDHFEPLGFKVKKYELMEVREN
jgi:hypothetical protein